MQEKNKTEFEKLVELIKILRGENGCPWDKKQTLETLKPCLLEETYEVLEVMDKGGEKLKGELGDLLLNIVFQADICEDKKEFNIDDVIKNLREKLIRRHPHIFPNENLNIELTNNPQDKNISSQQVLQNWEEIKKTEKEHEDRKSILDGIPTTFPPMMRTEKLLKKATSVGFDWENVDGVLDKIEEEIKELRVELKNRELEKIKDELGDVFFILINFTKHLGLNSSDVLSGANQKFERRFRYIEENCDLKNSTLAEMDNLWNEAKKLEKSGVLK